MHNAGGAGANSQHFNNQQLSQQHQYTQGLGQQQTQQQTLSNNSNNFNNNNSQNFSNHNKPTNKPTSFVFDAP